MFNLCVFFLLFFVAKQRWPINYMDLFFVCVCRLPLTFLFLALENMVSFQQRKACQWQLTWNFWILKTFFIRYNPNSTAKIMVGLAVAVVFYRSWEHYTWNLPIWVMLPEIPSIVSELQTFDKCWRILRNQMDCIRIIWIPKLENGDNVSHCLLLLLID